MKNQTETNVPNRKNLVEVCLTTCRNFLEQIEKTKEAILTEFRATLGAHSQLLRLALNEAEALAWQTDYPHLVFPALAVEKAQAVATWDARQRSLRLGRPARELAA